MLRLGVLWMVALEALSLRVGPMRAPQTLVRSGPSRMDYDRVFSADEAKGGVDVDPKKTAVLFIEYQNEFATEGGKLYDAVRAATQRKAAATGAAHERSRALLHRSRTQWATCWTRVPLWRARRAMRAPP